jgi:hypothetical protein
MAFGVLLATSVRDAVQRAAAPAPAQLPRAPVLGPSDRREPSPDPSRHESLPVARATPAKMARAALRTARDTDRRRSTQRSALRPGWMQALGSAGLWRPLGAPVEVAKTRHTPLTLRKHGLPVFNRRGRLHERDGRIVGTTGKFSLPPLRGSHFALDAERALSIATQRAGVSAWRGAPVVERGLWATQAGTLPVYRVTLPALRPLGTFEIVVDAVGGMVLDRGNRLRDVTGSGLTQRATWKRVGSCSRSGFLPSRTSSTRRREASSTTPSTTPSFHSSASATATASSPHTSASTRTSPPTSSATTSSTPW